MVGAANAHVSPQPHLVRKPCQAEDRHERDGGLDQKCSDSLHAQALLLAGGQHVEQRADRSQIVAGIRGSLGQIIRMVAGAGFGQGPKQS